MDRILQRELAVKLLYAMEIQNDFNENVNVSTREIMDLDTKDTPFTNQLVQRYLEHKEKVSDIVDSNSKNYPLKKLPTIDRIIINIALTEIYILNEPHQVAINEAVEISKKYSDESNYRFINSFLGTIVRRDNA